jgi:hypothetical protein
MAKRIGLARTQALIENLKRELSLNGTTLGGVLQKVETLNTVGSVAAPTKRLSSADSGRTFFIDISTVSVVCTLPAPEPGLEYTFVLSAASDGETAKDFLLNTHADSTDINGAVIVNNALIEVTSATSAVAIDSSAGDATCGDRLHVCCDGTDWYIDGHVDSASALVINNAADGITPA